MAAASLLSVGLLLCLTSPARAGAVGLWNFDDGSGSILTDRSAYGNDGAIHGATWTTGYRGGALSFDGSNDYVLVPDHDPSTDPSGAITIMAWAQYTGELSSLAWPSIVSKQASSSWSSPYARYNLRITTSEGSVFNFWTEGFSAGTLNGTTSPLTGTWYHVAATYDGSTQEEKLYVNGALQNSRSVLHTGISNSPYGITIGSQMSGGISEGAWRGLIDEVGIWDEALAQSQIQDLMRNGFPSATVVPLPSSAWLGLALLGALAITGAARRRLHARF